MNAEELIQSHSIPQLIELTSTLAKDAERKQIELQMMVGSRYPDTIAIMEEKVKYLNQLMESFRSKTSSLVDDTRQLLETADTLVTNNKSKGSSILWRKNMIIKNNLSEYNSENRIRELEELLKIEKQKNNLTISNRVPICQICFEPVECPVTFNNNNDGKCKSSQCNPSCLLCVRKYVDQKVKNGSTTFTCLSRCCTLEFGNPPCMVYGEIGRSLDDVPEPTMYRMIGSEGVTQCRRCNTDCVTVYNLAKHIRNECSFRKVKCKCCKKIMLDKSLKEHEKNCYFKCNLCGIRLPYLTKNSFAMIKREHPLICPSRK